MMDTSAAQAHLRDVKGTPLGTQHRIGGHPDVLVGDVGVRAFLLVLAILPNDLAWQAAGFVLFRFFDILKPPPIRWFERRLHGGFGVMFDDLLAAGYTLLVLALVKRFFLA